MSGHADCRALSSGRLAGEDKNKNKEETEWKESPDNYMYIFVHVCIT